MAQFLKRSEQEVDNAAPEESKEENPTPGESNEESRQGQEIDLEAYERIEINPTIEFDAHLGDDADGDDQEDMEEDGTEDLGSMMGHYLLAIQTRLRHELSSETNKAGDTNWLLNLLETNGFWIQKENAKFLCRKVGLSFDQPAYYCDLRVWLPEIEYWYGLTACLPCC